MDLGLKDKVAVVMASSRGLGRAIAMSLAAEGADLAIYSRREESIQRTAEEIRHATGRRVLARAVDVNDPAQIAQFASAVEKEFGKLHILINNSGGPAPGTFDTLDETKFLDAAHLLLLNVVRATKAFLPLIRRTGGGGRIINLTSTSVREPIANLMLSNALRGAVTGWAKTLSRELGPEGILVNCVAPGTIHTERIDELVAANAKKGNLPEAEVRKQMMGKIPLGRFGKPQEFADVVCFLAGDRASYISGTTIYVDGGAMSSVV